MSTLTAAFLANYQDLVSFLRRRTHCSQLAHDCAHDTWLRLVETGSRAQPDNQRAYVFRVAANIAIDWHRRRVREEAAFDQYSLAVAGHIVPDTYEVMVAQEMLRHIEQILLAQPTRSVRVFMMHRCDGMSYAEIARRLSLSVSAVEKHMMRILLAAHQALNG
ncbi:RNA polymerase sigma factor [Allopusillimonas ginsengisoli]|nr:RNA polymerase sigma factor [Allopusillimonas ginsengisoli]